MENKKITAIVLAAGNSTRFGKNRNKNFEIINNKTILEYSLNEFNENSYIDNIIVAVKENELEQVKAIVDRINKNKNFKFVIGGSTLQLYKCY